MQPRLQRHFNTHQAAISHRTPAQLYALQQIAMQLSVEAQVAALESEHLDGNIDEAVGIAITLESIQQCITTLKGENASRAVLNSINLLLDVQYSRLGLNSTVSANESFTDGELTLSLESRIWDTIKRIWQVVKEMAKKLLAFIVNIFRGQKAQQESHMANIQHAHNELNDFWKSNFNRDDREPVPANESSVLDGGKLIIVDVPHSVKDSLNVRDGKADISGLITDGIADHQLILHFKDFLFQGLAVLGTFQQTDAAKCQAAVADYIKRLYSLKIDGYRGPFSEEKGKQDYTSRWLRPHGGLKFTTPTAAAIEQVSGKPGWGAVSQFTHLVQGIVVQPYRDAPAPIERDGPIKLDKAGIFTFFGEVETFNKATVSYGTIYRMLYEDFDQRQRHLVTALSAAVGKNIEGDTDSEILHHAGIFATQLVRLSQRVGEIFQKTVAAQTQVLAGADHFSKELMRTVLASRGKKIEDMTV